MDKDIELLKVIDSSNLSYIDTSSEISIEAAQRLLDRGFIIGKKVENYGGLSVVNPKISYAGMQMLRSKANDDIPWWKSFDGRTAVLGLIVSIIGLWSTLL